ncbi:EcsC family protein [Agrococcus sp. TSP3-2-1]|uniref:EcsC family protein n=1 Tax=Agrococcus sp. TSP3-2-1 TaxID=2804583 RepID=UPI003CF5A589
MSATGTDRTSDMSPYELDVWASVNDYWEGRANRRGLPNWINRTVEGSLDAAGRAGQKAVDRMPRVIVEGAQRAGDAIGQAAVKPLAANAARVLELFNDWATDLVDPRSVEKLARKRGFDIESFEDLRDLDLKSCDRLLTRNTLRWRTVGAIEGGGMGALALVPVAGLPTSITADLVLVQAMSVVIASRIAYSYGFDAKDPQEQEFIHRLVRRSFVSQAAKAEPLRETAQAAWAMKDRVNWSQKLRADHRLAEAVEKLLQFLGPKGGHVSVQQVAKVLPVVGILVGAGTNSTVLGAVARDAQRFCQTRFLCEKYGLPLPVALSRLRDGESSSSTDAE